MDWIDGWLAVGSLADANDQDLLDNSLITAVVDVRSLFFLGHFNVQDLFDLVDEVIALSQTHRVLVHCFWGRDRGPFVAMIYMARKYGFSYEEAYDIVSHHHSVTVQHWEWVARLPT